MAPTSKSHGYIIMRTSLDTLGTEDTIAVAVHPCPLELKSRTAVEMLVAPEAVFRLALPANFGILPPDFERGEHGRHTDKYRERTLIEAEGSPFIEKTQPHCPQNQHYDQAGGKGRVIGNPITSVQKNEPDKETYSQPQVLQPAGIFEIETQAPFRFPPQTESLQPVHSGTKRAHKAPA